MGRDRVFQAILPLKGKILNVEKARLDKMLSNEEIRNIITALGTGIGQDEFDVTKLRYHRVIILSDADVDGAHIRTLILTFFFRHMQRPGRAGAFVHRPAAALQPEEGERDSLRLQRQKSAITMLAAMSQNGKGVYVQRYKGLGEMNPEQLWETTMNPANRTVRRVTLEDAVEAETIFTILMGEEVEPRRKFIEDNAHDVVNLDV